MPELKADVETSITSEDVYSTGEEVVIRGTVLDNYLGCTFDTSCYLHLNTEGKEIEIYYHYGRTPYCLNTRATDQGLKIKKGEQVEVFGQYERPANPKVISVCHASTYYIRKLN